LIVPFIFQQYQFISYIIVQTVHLVRGQFGQYVLQANKNDSNEGRKFRNPGEDSGCELFCNFAEKRESIIDKVVIFAASYFQILFNGPRRVWRYAAKMVKIEVP